MNDTIFLFFVCAVVFVFLYLDYKSDKKIDLGETNKNILELSTMITGILALFQKTKNQINDITKDNKDNNENIENERKEEKENDVKKQE